MSDLVTLDEQKEFLGIKLADTERDVLIQTFLDSVEQQVKNLCETNFQETVVTSPPGELHDGSIADVILPFGFPILSVEKISVGTETDGTGGIDLETDEFYFDDTGIMLRGRLTPRARGNISLAYTYGFEEVPADVKLAVMQSVKAELQRHDANTENISSRSKEGESESLRSAWDPKSGLPVQIASKLQSYKLFEFPHFGMAQRNR